MLVEGIMRTISVNCFEFGPLDKKMSFKVFFFFYHWRLFCPAEHNHLCILVQGIRPEFFH